MTKKDDRKRAIERVRRRLLRGGWPRLFMSFLLILTGGAGFLVSSALLHLGVEQMAVRYPLAVLAAYSVFLLLLRLWLALQRRNWGRFDANLDLAGLDLNPFGSSVSPSDAAGFGGGGDFGGGGAGGSWEASPTPPGSSLSGGSSSIGSGASSGGGSSFDLGLDVDFDEGCFLLLIPILAIVGLLAAMFYVVYVAPIFLAEIMVDGLLLAGLYKRLKKIEPQHWLRSCVRRTLWPVVLTTALFIAAGYLMQRARPEARSIGDFWQRVASPEKRRR